MRKRIAEVEESNEISTLALSRTRYSIRRLRLEYSILLERLESRLATKEVSGFTDSEFRNPLMLNEDLKPKFQCIEEHKSAMLKETSNSSSLKKDIRDPGMPKRPTNAYLMFCERERENIRADIERKNPGQPIVDFPKLLTEIWRGMNESERMPYWKLFLEDRERYQLEMQIYSNKKRNLNEVPDGNINGNKCKLDSDEVSVYYNDHRGGTSNYYEPKTSNEGTINGKGESVNTGVMFKMKGEASGNLNQQDNKENTDFSNAIHDDSQVNQRSRANLETQTFEQRNPHDEVPQEVGELNSVYSSAHGKIPDAEDAHDAVKKS